MKTIAGLVLVAAAIGFGAGNVQAGDKYHVYKQSNGVCEADQRTHEQYDNARGSGWKCLAEFDYLSDAQNELEKLKANGTCG